MGGSGKQELIKISPLLSNVSASSSCDSYGLPMDVDENELSGENASVYLFQWLTSPEPKSEKSLLAIITGNAPYPPPGRAFRQLVARCLVKAYSTGETRGLFDTIQTLMALTSNERDVVRIAAYWCIGELMGRYGSQFMSFMAEIAVNAIKTHRSSSNHLLRYHALICLQKALHAAKKAVPDQSFKDINKYMKTALTDKSWAVQRAATQVLIALHSSPDPIALTTSEIEQVLAQSVKALDSVDRFTRQAHARLTAHLLSESQVEGRKDLSSTMHSDSRQQKTKHDSDPADADDPPSANAASEQKSKPLLTPNEMLAYLSKEINKPNASRKTRIAIFEVYAALFVALGPDWLESNLSIVLQHLVADIVTHPRLTPPTLVTSASAASSTAASALLGNTARYERLLIRHLVSLLLRDLVELRMLSEQGHISAITDWASNHLKRWPAMMPGQAEPKESALVLALRQVGGLLVLLGNAPGIVQSALSDPLVTLLSHPSHSVRINAAWALRCFCASTPLRLAKIILALTDKLSTHLSALTNPSSSQDTPQRVLGSAYGLAALVSLIPHRPWYVSYDVPTKIMDLAVVLLKKSGEHQVDVAGVEVEVAWRLMSGCMSLGKGFLRGYLPQLLVLWRNALPKITSKDSAPAGRTGEEWVFLMHVRECALGAILCFLRNHSDPSSNLITLDVARRIAACLSNALAFANGFLSVAHTVEDPMLALPEPGAATQNVPRKTGLSLRDREALLRSRVFECFCLLTLNSSGAVSGPSNAQSTGVVALSEGTQDALLRSTIALFASQEGYGGSTVQAAIVSSTGNFGSIWSPSGNSDGYAYGMGWRVVEEVWVTNGGDKQDAGVEGVIDSYMRRPILGACEQDPLSICLPSPPPTASSKPPSTTSSSLPYEINEIPPPGTAVVDSSIELFSRLLPLQDQTTTLKIIQLMIDEVRSNKADKNAGRKAAVWVNACVALVLTLRRITTTRETSGSGFSTARTGIPHALKDVWGNEKVTALLRPFLMEAVTDGDPILRSAASEAIGRLASVSGTASLAAQVKDLVDTVVNNRTPSSRAGSAWAFGAVHTHVGGLAAGPLLKTTVNVLMSLASDPHPIVHYHALRALGQVIDAASLGYGVFISATLGILLKIYLLETHERENGAGGKNVDVGEGWGEWVVDCASCRTMDAVIGVLGPDIQESTRTRAIILGLVNEFWTEGGGAIKGASTQNEGRIGLVNVGTGVEAIKCIQHFLIFAPEHADIPSLVQRFRAHLASTSPTLRPLKVASINALYQLVQKDAVAMSKLGGDRLVEDLFALLDDGDDASVSGGVKSVIESWLNQTAVLNPGAWIGLCQRIMSKTTAGQRVADSSGIAASGSGGDEGESLSVSVASTGATSRVQQMSRWRTQLFALQCLHTICTLVANSDRKEHLSAIVARTKGLPVEHMLFWSVGDLVKMAFTASTAYVSEIRLAGLVVLRDVIQTFSMSPDPAYDDALLLEQHQAPITAALTPAFSTDSTPEILASAVNACAVFVGCGVVKDTGKMGRILKLLTTALDQAKGTGMLSLGDAEELSPNASAMLRISTLSAWARLQVASTHQTYLENVLKPYRSVLASLWVSSLRDYGSIRIDSEGVGGEMGAASGAIDSSYGTLGREVLLPYYATAWPVILDAIATLMDRDDGGIRAAMDGREPTDDPIKIASTQDPVAFFYVIFGLAYEALASSSTDNVASGSTENQQRQDLMLSSLFALKSLVRPEYCGRALNDPTIFEEFLSLCYRLALTESPPVQSQLVTVIGRWALDHGRKTTGGSDVLSLTEPLAHVLRICAHIVKQTVSSRGLSSALEKVALLSTTLTTFAGLLETINPPTQREDVRSIGILLYSDLLKDEASEFDFVSPTLPALKMLIEIPLVNRTEEIRERFSKLLHSLLSLCLLNVDSMRGRTGLISTKKMKTNLLAAALVLTVAPLWVQFGLPALEHCAFLVSQKLADFDDATLTAAHVARTLILASSTGSVALKACTRMLLPGTVDFVVRAVPSLRDASISEQHLAAIGEIWKAYVGFYTTAHEEIRTRLLGVLLPTMILVLPSSAPSSSPAVAAFERQTVTHLLSFASTSPAAFKEATSLLEPSAKELLEQAIRKVVGGTGATSIAASKPQIVLKSF